MSTYVITELQNANSRRKGEFVEAKSLSAAKRKASRMQMFQGTAIEVATEGGTVLAIKEAGQWEDR